jgi:hypothetical protein
MPTSRDVWGDEAQAPPMVSWAEEPLTCLNALFLKKEL